MKLVKLFLVDIWKRNKYVILMRELFTIVDFIVVIFVVRIFIISLFFVDVFVGVILDFVGRVFGVYYWLAVILF